MENKELFDKLAGIALSLGAYKATVIPVELVETNAAFRDMCAANACGNYGRNWMCPPDAGDIHDLMAALKTYSYALVYQTVSELEDSYDFEGMMDAGVAHNKLMIRLREKLNAEKPSRVLHLGAGGCRMCEVCAKRTGEPCRHPDSALPPMEGYGIDVYNTTKPTELKYINGQNTVTYFGMVLFSE